jgi:hypothetical protein
MPPPRCRCLSRHLRAPLLKRRYALTRRTDHHHTEEGTIAGKGAITVREAGRRGGTQTKRKYGPGSHKSIGKKGGETTKQRHGPQFHEKIGRKSGQTMRGLIEQGKREAKKRR